MCDLRPDEERGEVFLCRSFREACAEATCAQETEGVTSKVNIPEAKHMTRSTTYASSGDFRGIFHEETDSLYRLSFLLTADHEKAEQCFVSGLEDSVNGSPVFKEWARSWARRPIIHNAVRVINPHPTEEQAPPSPNSDGKTPAGEEAEIAAVLELG